jgi:hypothetical protein
MHRRDADCRVRAMRAAHPRRSRWLRIAAWIGLACWTAGLAGLAGLGWLAATRAQAHEPLAAATNSGSPDPILTTSPADPTPSPLAGPTATGTAVGASSGAPAATAASPSPSPLLSPRPEPAVLREVRVLPGTEPDVAASPYRPGLVAVVSQNVSSAGCARPSVAVSTDSGATWAAPAHPWRGCQDKHATIAWGPGPDPGSSRLWVTNAIVVAGGLSLSVTYSDDMGATWSKPYVSRSTPPWSGCFPTIAVDNSPASPDFGTVYVAYNWLMSASSVGIEVLATRDGVTWSHTEVPVRPFPEYPFTWRFGYRLAVSPTGGAYLSFYEGDMATWNAADMWEIGKPSNTGRAGYAISRIGRSASGALSATAPVWVTDVRVSTSPVFDPECQSQLAVDLDGGIWLVVSDRPVIGGGFVKVGHSTDGGTTWAWTKLTVPGTEGFKASLAISGRTVFVGWHAMEKSGSVHTYFTTSVDGGLFFAPPEPVSASTFRMPSIVNGTGLREAAAVGSGFVYYAWGDDRSGLAIYVAVVVV